MENASKALLMAAVILISVIILSIAVYLFTYFSDYARGVEDDVRANQIAQFNSQFLSYQGKELTIYDVITLANLAKDYNQENEYTSGVKGYITVTATPFSGEISESSSNDISTISEDKIYVMDRAGNATGELIKYKCNVTVDSVTKMVSSVTISQ